MFSLYIDCTCVWADAKWPAAIWHQYMTCALLECWIWKRSIVGPSRRFDYDVSKASWRCLCCTVICFLLKGFCEQTRVVLWETQTSWDLSLWTADRYSHRAVKPGITYRAAGLNRIIQYVWCISVSDVCKYRNKLPLWPSVCILYWANDLSGERKQPCW